MSDFDFDDLNIQLDGAVNTPEEDRGELVARVEANESMPQDEKTQVLGQLREARVPSSLVRRIETKAGG